MNTFYLVQFVIVPLEIKFLRHCYFGLSRHGSTIDSKGKGLETHYVICHNPTYGL